MIGMTAVIVLFVCFLQTAVAQQPQGAMTRPVKPVVQSSTADSEAAMPPVSVEGREKIRDLQYEQDRKIIQKKNLQLEEDKLQKEIDDIDRQIQQVAYDEAVKAGVDVSHSRLDLDAVRWSRVKPEEKK